MQILTAPHPMLKTVCRPDFTISFDLFADRFCLLRKHRGRAARRLDEPGRTRRLKWARIGDASSSAQRRLKPSASDRRPL
ncbi:MAG TPA: hypothetical protein VMV10_27895 [Pirellulales bacterium]|nr:hypothetical protein [Pirellulales bacterium]